VPDLADYLDLTVSQTGEQFQALLARRPVPGRRQVASCRLRPCCAWPPRSWSITGTTVAVPRTGRPRLRDQISQHHGAGVLSDLETERMLLAAARVGQHVFARQLLANCGSRCVGAPPIAMSRMVDTVVTCQYALRNLACEAIASGAAWLSHLTAGFPPVPW
jgi:hypothetical protein